MSVFLLFSCFVNLIVHKTENIKQNNFSALDNLRVYFAVYSHYQKSLLWTKYR